MRKKSTILLAVILILSLSGCASITMSAQGLAQPVVMNSELGPGVGYRSVDTIKEKDRALWLFGFINIKDPDIRGMLLDGSAAADAYTDVEIKTMFRPLDLVLTYVTAGMIVSRTVVVRASVVEFLD